MRHFPLIRPLFACFFLLSLLAPSAQASQTILVFGDSLSAAFGITQEAAWPSLLMLRLQQKNMDYNVVNASISGETTSGGRTRLAAALAKHRPALVIIALGSNDGLRGLPIDTIRANLNAMIDNSLQQKAKILLVAQRLPPNYGAYAGQFERVFGEVAQAKKVALSTFLLDQIATQPAFFQADRLHPTAEAQPYLLDNVWKTLEPLLQKPR